MVQLMQYALLLQQHSVSLTHKCVAAKVIKCTFFGFGIDFCEQKKKTNSTFTMDLAQDFKCSFFLCFCPFHRIPFASHLFSMTILSFRLRLILFLCETHFHLYFLWKFSLKVSFYKQTIYMHKFKYSP